MGFGVGIVVGFGVGLVVGLAVGLAVGRAVGVGVAVGSAADAISLVSVVSDGFRIDLTFSAHEDKTIVRTRSIATGAVSNLDFILIPPCKNPIHSLYLVIIEMQEGFFIHYLLPYC